MVCSALLLPDLSFATEKDPKDTEGNQQEQEAKEDSLTIFEDENKISDPFVLEDQVVIPREERSSEKRANTYSTAQTDNPEVSEEESNSAMSFNFIYYIIDKFKLADPLD